MGINGWLQNNPKGDILLLLSRLNNTLMDKTQLQDVNGWGGKFFLGPNHTYWWKNTKKAEPRPLSGVTSVLNVIAKPALIPWAVKMTVEKIKAATTGVAFLSVEQFHLILDESKGAHKEISGNAADLGKEAHALLEAYVKASIGTNGGVPLETPTSPDARVAEFTVWACARNKETGFKFVASEESLADPKLAIAGTPDFIAVENGEEKEQTIIGDLKTGSGIYDRVYFAQMAAYGYMWMKKHKLKLPPKLVIIHSPASKPEQPLAEHWSDAWKEDWEAFKAALLIHRWKDNFIRSKK